MAGLPGSKRKENAQEVEFVSVYNKRLRKSFIRAHDVRKSTSSRSHTASPNKLLSEEFETSAIGFSSSNIAPAPVLRSEASVDPGSVPVIRSETSVDPGSVPVIRVERSRKRKQGKVWVDAS
jgi:hypothetical protein